MVSDTTIILQMTNLHVFSTICSVIGSSGIWESVIGKAPGVVSAIVVVVSVTVPVGGATVMDIVVSTITAPAL